MLVGLALTPIIVSVAIAIAPHLALTSALQDLFTFLLAVGTVTVSLYTLAQGFLSNRGWLVVGSVSGAALGVLAIWGVHSAVAVVFVGFSLIALGYAVGHAVGSRIEHPGHLMPACFVAGCVDVASVFHPQGPTLAVIESERALSLLTLSFPVLGSEAYAPTIGVGDIIFASVVFGAATKHQLPTRRIAGLLALSLIVAGLGSALVQHPVPALPAIGLFVVLGVGEARNLRKKDRKVASAFMLGAAALATGAIVTRILA